MTNILSFRTALCGGGIAKSQPDEFMNHDNYCQLCSFGHLIKQYITV